MRFLVIFCVFIFMTGSSLAQHTPEDLGRYKKIYILEKVTIIFADSRTINEEYQKRGGKKEVRAFAIPYSNVIYCSELDFFACGHELYHLTNKFFHK